MISTFGKTYPKSIGVQMPPLATPPAAHVFELSRPCANFAYGSEMASCIIITET